MSSTRGMFGTRLNGFEEWKWRSLRSRRVFFLFLINIILTFSWVAIHYDDDSSFCFHQIGSCLHVSHEEEETSNNFSMVILYGIPSFFFCLHGAACIFILFSTTVIHETQGNFINKCIYVT